MRKKTHAKDNIDIKDDNKNISEISYQNLLSFLKLNKHYFLFLPHENQSDQGKMISVSWAFLTT